MKTKLILALIIGLLLVSCQSEKRIDWQKSQTRVQNLETFARLYGYTRWFHPSDEAQEIDWDKFAILGVQKVENIKSTSELRDILYELFSPIVHGLQIYEERKPEIFHKDILFSPDPDAKPIAWQHSGVYLNDKSNIYKSIRVNKCEINQVLRSTTVVKYLSDSSDLNSKDVKFSGYFRSNNIGAKLFIQSLVSSGNNRYEVIINSIDWKKYELTLTIPQEATGIIYGLEVDGEVEVWADNFEFAVNSGGKWIFVDTTNMGFECGKTKDEVKPIKHWMTSMMYHTVEITDENPYSGKYCLKVSFPEKMFKPIPEFGEIIKTSIGNNLICVVPLTLLTNGSTTYPKTETEIFTRLQSELADITINRYGFNPQANLASVIIAWNVLQHFFPYFDVIDTDWNKVLGETLNSALGNKQKNDFFITLSQMFAKINDGHGIVYGEQLYNLPIRTEFIEDNIVITASNNTTLERGDIIKEIDGKPVMEALAEKEKIISGSPQLKRHRALNILGSKLDPGETHLLIKRNGEKQNVIVANSRRGNIFFNPVDDRKYVSETIVEIEPGIYYINMTNCSEDEFERKKEMLAYAKAVIYDQRGGKLDFFQILPYWIEKPVTSAWWNIPQTDYPDRKKVEFYKSNWDIQPRQPLFQSKSIIINIPSVVSSGETMMGIIDHYNLATTVGETTAGCNGNRNTINMPCGYYAWFTGMKVLKHDGSQLYLKGFEPDYPVKRTIQAIKESRDEYLEKALEIARL